MIARLARAIDRRMGGDSFVASKLTHMFPESWTFLFGELALYSFVVLVITGTFLALFYDASLAETVYTGSYEPLHGVRMSAAYESVVSLSFDVRAGLLIRQMHHWAANVFVASIVVHLMRVFFTGAFRKPRELNWVIGVTMLVLAIIEGYAGYSLIDDLLSGIGLRIGYSILESIPVVGLWLATMVFGGLFPGEEILNRLFTFHVFIIPTLFFALITLHLSLIFRQSHTQFPGAGRRESNTVGLRTWPEYAATSVGLFFLVTAVIAGLGAVVQINPIWFWGPYEPFTVSIIAQPDWYMGWLEGSLRLFPPWEITIGEYLIPNPFFAAVLLPLVTFGVMYAYPWIERRLTGDIATHHLLDRPRYAPVRTAFGWAVFSFFFVLLVAGSQDIIAYQLNVSITGLVYFLRFALLVLPVLVFWFAYAMCKSLQHGEAFGAVEAHKELEEEEEEPNAWRRWQLPVAAPLARLFGRGGRS